MNDDDQSDWLCYAPCASEYFIFLFDKMYIRYFEVLRISKHGMSITTGISIELPRRLAQWIISILNDPFTR